LNSASNQAESLEVVLAHRQQSEYFSALSHELRTPLNGLMGYANLLLDGHYGALAPAQEKAVNEIQESAKHLLGVIESLLAFSRVSQGRQVPRVSEVPVAGIVQRLSDRLRPLVFAKRLDLEVAAEDFSVFTDESMLEQIVTNLLGNAIKFTPKGGRLKMVCRRLPELGAFEVGVADTGPGIPTEARGRIFEPFVQLASPNVRAHGGTGLGLALCRWYASTLQGVIGVEDNAPQGSYFFVLLPEKLRLFDGFAPVEDFRALVRQAGGFSTRAGDQFAVLEIGNAPELPVEEWRRLVRASDIIGGGDGKVYLALYGAEPLSARMLGERLKNSFLYERRLNIQVKLLRFEDFL
jgi:signal transduction histidine kinase